MRIRLGDSDIKLPAHLRRYPLLAAYLDAMHRLDGPRFPVVVRNTQRRPLLHSIEYHRLGRRLSPHLTVVLPARGDGSAAPGERG
jgi:hypothetical protein